MKLKINPTYKERSILGYDQLELLSFGYNQEGILQSVVCMSEIGLVVFNEPEISDDLIEYYIPADYPDNLWP